MALDPESGFCMTRIQAVQKGKIASCSLAGLAAKRLSPGKLKNEVTSIHSSAWKKDVVNTGQRSRGLILRGFLEQIRIGILNGVTNLTIDHGFSKESSTSTTTRLSTSARL